MLVATGSVYAYANWRLNQIHRIVLPSILHKPANVAVVNAEAAAAANTEPLPGAMTILIVGSDSRAAADDGGETSQFGSADVVGGQRSDTIMLLRVNPATTSATLLSIPRDLWVPIPGSDTSNRINSTFDTGADLLVKTIETDLGIGIDHYIEVNFQSFRDIVNAVGGVEEYFPTPARDAYSLLNIPAAGCYNMTGNMALSFVRSRHYEYKVNGRWVYEAESDLARIQRQQSFIKKMIAKAQSSGLTNPLELNNVIGGVTTNLTVDSGFSQSLMLTLAKRFRNISPAGLPTSTLPTTATVIGGADVLLLEQPEARQAIYSFLNPPPPPPSTPATTTPTTITPTTVPSVAPSTVQVSVLNGSGQTGQATATATALRGEGFDVSDASSASNFNYATTVIEYQPTDLAQAQLVASVVQGGSQLQADSTLQGAGVTLITGQSFQGIGALPAAGTSVTVPTTTVPSTTTTTTYALPGTPPGFIAPTC